MYSLKLAVSSEFPVVLMLIVSEILFYLYLLIRTKFPTDRFQFAVL